MNKSKAEYLEKRYRKVLLDNVKLRGEVNSVDTRTRNALNYLRSIKEENHAHIVYWTDRFGSAERTLWRIVAFFSLAVIAIVLITL